MERPIRVACLIPMVNDPTSYYRGLGPISHLQKATGHKFYFTFLPNTPPDWAYLKMHDILFMQRPFLPDHFNWLCLAKDMGLPVMIDFDDDNLAVPEGNPMWDTYSQPPIKDAIVKLARYADVVTVATENLRKKYSIYAKNCFVIPNAIDDTLLHLRRIPEGPRAKRILWRGTITHKENLEVVQNQVMDIAKKHKDWQFTFFGFKPLQITKHLRNAEYIPPFQVIEYFKQLMALHSSCLYYSLNQDDHAQARSMVCWLESTFANHVSILPKTSEFTHCGTLNFETPQEFETLVESVMNSEIDIDKQVSESWTEIMDKYTLSKVNGVRLELYNKLTGRE